MCNCGDPAHGLGRRHLLLVSGASLAAAVATPIANAVAQDRGSAEAKSLAFRNIHTGEAIDVTFKKGGAWLPDNLKALDRHMRDPWDHSVHKMDRRLLEVLHRLHGLFETEAPFVLISGYRSPRTNGILASRSRGVAKRSYHMRGMAADVRLPGVDARQLYQAALSLKAGGVGLYSRSNFVHVDVGPVRTWGA
jgi:uncharacterized protein YcbK (DUF882 family)